MQVESYDVFGGEPKQSTEEKFECDKCAEVEVVLVDIVNRCHPSERYNYECLSCGDTFSCP